MTEKQANIEELHKEINELKNEIKTLKERLQKYTNSDGHKNYYEKNKETVKAKAKTYLQKLKEENPEKLKEYRRRYYLKQKAHQNDESRNSANNHDISIKTT